MAQDFVEQITENIEIDKIFAIQIDESVDVSDEAELLLYIRYFDIKKGSGNGVSVYPLMGLLE
jgi:hypothetical protein